MNTVAGAFLFHWLKSKATNLKNISLYFKGGHVEKCNIFIYFQAKP